MTVADGRLWVLGAANTVVGIDPRTNAVVGKPLRAPADAAAIAVSQGALWVARVAPGDLGAPRDDTVTRIDLATGRAVATISVGRGPLDVVATPGTVWVTNSGGAAAASSGSTRKPTSWLADRSGPAPARRAWPSVVGRYGSPTMTRQR